MRRHSFLLAILAIFIFVKLTLLFTYHLPIWDEAVYLGMGKSLYSDGQSGLWEPLRPIGLPLLLGMLWKLPGYVKAAEILSIAFAAGTIILVYATADLLFGRKTAVIGAVLASTFPLFFSYSSHILSDIPAAFFGLLALYLYARQKTLAAGMSIGTAIMFKFTQVILVAAFGLALLARKEKNAARKALLLAGGFAIITLPFLGFNYLSYRDESNALEAAFHPMLLASWHQSNPAASIAGTGLESSLKNAFFYFGVIGMNNLVMLLFIIGMAACLAKPDGKREALAFSALALLAYFTYIPNKQERFALLFTPFIAILAAYGLLIAMKKLDTRAGLIMVIILLTASSMLVAALDAQYYLKRSREPPEIAELYEYIDKNGINGTILTSDPAFAAYTDKRLTPYYFSAEDGLRIYDSTGSATLIFTPASFYCAEMDKACIHARKELHEKIESNKLLHRENFYGKEYLIYSK